MAQSKAEARRILQQGRVWDRDVVEMGDDGILVQTGTLPVLIIKWDVINGSLKNKGRFQSGPPTS